MPNIVKKTHYKSCHTSLKKVAVIAGEINDHTVNLTWGGDLLRKRALSNELHWPIWMWVGKHF
jgi:hypothetical protein